MASVEKPELIEAIVTCEGNLHDPDFSTKFQQLVGNLKSVLYTSKKKRLEVKRIEPWNSVRVTINIPKEAAQKLKLLAQQGSNLLRSLGILSVQVEGDQVISLTLAGHSDGPSTSQEVRAGPSTLSLSGTGSSLLTNAAASRVLSAGTSSSASVLDKNLLYSSTSSPSSSSSAFQSPNVVAPKSEIIPPKPVPKSLPPKVGVGTPPLVPTNSPRYPFASMTHAAQASKSKAADSTNVINSVKNSAMSQPLLTQSKATGNRLASPLISPGSVGSHQSLSNQRVSVPPPPPYTAAVHKITSSSKSTFPPATLTSTSVSNVNAKCSVDSKINNGSSLSSLSSVCGNSVNDIGAVVSPLLVNLLQTHDTNASSPRISPKNKLAGSTISNKSSTIVNEKKRSYKNKRSLSVDDRNKSGVKSDRTSSSLLHKQGTSSLSNESKQIPHTERDNVNCSAVAKVLKVKSEALTNGPTSLSSSSTTSSSSSQDTDAFSSIDSSATSRLSVSVCHSSQSPGSLGTSQTKQSATGKPKQFLINPLTGHLEPMPLDSESKGSIGTKPLSEEEEKSKGKVKSKHIVTSSGITVARVVKPIVDVPTEPCFNHDPAKILMDNMEREKSAERKEKIKLKLKLDKKEHGATKAELNMLKKPDSGGLQASSNEQPPLRVPPLHISLRGKNAAVVVSPRREEVVSSNSNQTASSSKATPIPSSSNSTKRMKNRIRSTDDIMVNDGTTSASKDNNNMVGFSDLTSGTSVPNVDTKLKSKKSSNLSQKAKSVSSEADTTTLSVSASESNPKVACDVNSQFSVCDKVIAIPNKKLPVEKEKSKVISNQLIPQKTASIISKLMSDQSNIPSKDNFVQETIMKKSELVTTHPATSIQKNNEQINPVKLQPSATLSALEPSRSSACANPLLNKLLDKGIKLQDKTPAVEGPYTQNTQSQSNCSKVKPAIDKEDEIVKKKDIFEPDSLEKPAEEESSKSRSATINQVMDCVSAESICGLSSSSPNILGNPSSAHITANKEAPGEDSGIDSMDALSEKSPNQSESPQRRENEATEKYLPSLQSEVSLEEKCDPLIMEEVSKTDATNDKSREKLETMKTESSSKEPPSLIDPDGLRENQHVQHSEPSDSNVTDIQSKVQETSSPVTSLPDSQRALESSEGTNVEQPQSCLETSSVDASNSVKEVSEKLQPEISKPCEQDDLMEVEATFEANSIADEKSDVPTIISVHSISEPQSSFTVGLPSDIYRKSLKSDLDEEKVSESLPTAGSIPSVTVVSSTSLAHTGLEDNPSSVPLSKKSNAPVGSEVPCSSADLCDKPLSPVATLSSLEAKRLHAVADECLKEDTTPELQQIPSSHSYVPPFVSNANAPILVVPPIASVCPPASITNPSLPIRPVTKLSAAKTVIVSGSSLLASKSLVSDSRPKIQAFIPSKLPSDNNTMEDSAPHKPSDIRLLESIDEQKIEGCVNKTIQVSNDQLEGSDAFQQAHQPNDRLIEERRIETSSSKPVLPKDAPPTERSPDAKENPLAEETILPISADPSTTDCANSCTTLTVNLSEQTIKPSELTLPDQPTKSEHPNIEVEPSPESSREADLEHTSKSELDSQMTLSTEVKKELYIGENQTDINLKPRSVLGEDQLVMEAHNSGLKKEEIMHTSPEKSTNTEASSSCVSSEKVTNQTTPTKIEESVSIRENPTLGNNVALEVAPTPTFVNEPSKDTSVLKERAEVAEVGREHSVPEINLKGETPDVRKHEVVHEDKEVKVFEVEVNSEALQVEKVMKTSQPEENIKAPQEQTKIEPSQEIKNIQTLQQEEIIETRQEVNNAETSQDVSSIEIPEEEKLFETPQVENISKDMQANKDTGAPEEEKSTDTPQIEKNSVPPQVENITAPQVLRNNETPQEDKKTEAVELKVKVQSFAEETERAHGVEKGVEVQSIEVDEKVQIPKTTEKVETQEEEMKGQVLDANEGAVETLLFEKEVNAALQEVTMQENQVNFKKQEVIEVERKVNVLEIEQTVKVSGIKQESNVSELQQKVIVSETGKDALALDEGKSVKMTEIEKTLKVPQAEVEEKAPAKIILLPEADPKTKCSEARHSEIIREIPQTDLEVKLNEMNKNTTISKMSSDSRTVEALEMIKSKPLGNVIAQEVEKKVKVPEMVKQIIVPKLEKLSHSPETGKHAISPDGKEQLNFLESEPQMKVPKAGPKQIKASEIRRPIKISDAAKQTKSPEAGKQGKSLEVGKQTKSPEAGKDIKVNEMEKLVDEISKKSPSVRKAVRVEAKLNDAVSAKSTKAPSALSKAQCNPTVFPVVSPTEPPCTSVSRQNSAKQVISLENNSVTEPSVVQAEGNKSLPVQSSRESLVSHNQSLLKIHATTSATTSVTCVRSSPITVLTSAGHKMVPIKLLTVPHKGMSSSQQLLEAVVSSKQRSGSPIMHAKIAGPSSMAGSVQLVPISVVSSNHTGNSMKVLLSSPVKMLMGNNQTIRVMRPILQHNSTHPSTSPQVVPPVNKTELLMSDNNANNPNYGMKLSSSTPPKADSSSSKVQEREEMFRNMDGVELLATNTNEELPFEADIIHDEKDLADILASSGSSGKVVENGLASTSTNTSSKPKGPNIDKKVNKFGSLQLNETGTAKAIEQEITTACFNKYEKGQPTLRKNLKPCNVPTSLSDHNYSSTSELRIDIPPLENSSAAPSPHRNSSEGKRSTRSNTRMAISPDITAIPDESPKAVKNLAKPEANVARVSPRSSNHPHKILSPAPIAPNCSSPSLDKDPGKGPGPKKCTGKRKRQESDGNGASKEDNEGELDLNARPGKRRCSENAAELIKACIGVEDNPKKNSAARKTEDSVTSGNSGYTSNTISSLSNPKSRDTKLKKSDGDNKNHNVHLTNEGQKDGGLTPSDNRTSGALSNSGQNCTREDETVRDAKVSRSQLSVKKEKGKAEELLSDHSTIPGGGLETKKRGKLGTRKGNAKKDGTKKAPVISKYRKEAVLMNEKNSNLLQDNPDSGNARRKTRSSVADIAENEAGHLKRRRISKDSKS